jgi:hypothetical protein
MLEKKGSSAEGAEETGGWTSALFIGDWVVLSRVVGLTRLQR